MDGFTLFWMRRRRSCLNTCAKTRPLCLRLLFSRPPLDAQAPSEQAIFCSLSTTTISKKAGARRPAVVGEQSQTVKNGDGSGGG